MTVTSNRPSLPDLPGDFLAFTPSTRAAITRYAMLAVDEAVVAALTPSPAPSAAPTAQAPSVASPVGMQAENDERSAWYGVQDEVTLTRAVHVMNDVLGDISGWEDTALADAVKDSKISLMAMIEVIRMNADETYVPGSKQIDGETFGASPAASAVLVVAELKVQP